MINLVYIILIAMLAINISADTLDTYSLLDRGLKTRIGQMHSFSGSLRSDIAKAHPATDSAMIRIDSMTNDLLAYIDGLKEDIARAADKKKYISADSLRNMEELNAVPDVMLSAVNPRGAILRERLTAYRDTLLASVSDPDVRSLISSCLSIEHDRRLTSWEKATFTSMPAIGGMVYLNTLKENILISQTEAFRDIAFSVISRQRSSGPDTAGTESRYVLINSDQKIVDKDGTIEVPVVSAYPYMERILYSEYDNPVEIMAIGIMPDAIDYRVEGGSGGLRHGRYYICPDAGSSRVRLHMSCVRNGERKDLGSQTFRVKPLPTPSPYILLQGGDRYTGNVPVEKSRIASAFRIGAGISEPVAIDYQVIRFETVLIRSGNKDIMSAASDGPELTDAQKKLLLSAENGDKIYFTGITVRSPKGSATYELPPVSAPVYE